MINKITFRDQIRSYLEEQILTGEIELGQRISLPDVARTLEVSVTPVREALTQLTMADVVTYVPNKGFFFAKLGEEEAAQIYPIISALESKAVAKINFTPKLIQRLKRCQKEFKNAKKVEEIVQLDQAFHTILIEEYDNKIMKRILSELKIRVFFYELIYMNDKENFKNSIACHNRIINYLIEKDKMGVQNEIAENWTIDLSVVAQNTEVSRHN